MRRLILLRHAKSSWEDPGLEDRDRPLAPRGQAAAPRMGAWLAAQGWTPDVVITSDSARTLQTWALARAALPGSPDALAAPRLYHADPATMLAALRQSPAAAATVLMIGHQPGIGGFARMLADPSTPAACARAFSHFPTAAMAALDFDAPDWASVGWGAGRFHSFVTPRDLGGGDDLGIGAA